MPRPLVIGNGNLLVAMDRDLFIRDFTFPQVGLLNHVSGHRLRIGLWAAGQFVWLDNPGWQKHLRYETDTLVTRAECHHERLGVTLTVSDCVLHRDNVLLRRFDIVNHWQEPREIRLFLAHDFYISETDIGDTAFYNPYLDGIIHYKRDVYFLLSGRAGNGGEEGLFQWTTGIKGFAGAEGTWRDAEDGWLSMNPVEQGSVDSTLSLRVVVAAQDTQTLRAWICVGHNLSEVTALQERVKSVGFDLLRQQTANYWTAWSRNEVQDPRLAQLPPQIAAQFRRSLLIIRTQIDNGGAILAANDSDILETARAHYSYMWPRDGALVAASLDTLGYQDITRRFFLFCRKVLPGDSGVLMHKYSADGSWGATWHPWSVDGHKEIPFQQDSTALVLWALARHYQRHRDLEFLDGLYHSLVVQAADFMVQYRDQNTGLPQPSYDLWEERRGVHAYTCGTVYGALRAAATLARLFDDPRAEMYDATAAQLQSAIAAHLWDPIANRFARRLVIYPDGRRERDMVHDSAVYGLTAFGAFSPTDPRIRSTMDQTLARLQVNTDIGGVARYEGDYYFRSSNDFAHVPGNPWIICTLWAAQYELACATKAEDLKPVLQRLSWAVTRAAESGVLPEQIHPYTGEPLSVSPLTWSHAEFIATTLQYLNRSAELGA
jgi:GH15 family glucan-1,4-alpha-glucosidase